MLHLLQNAIVWGALVCSIAAPTWSLPILIFFLPLMQWLPDTGVPGLNAFNLLTLPVIIRALIPQEAKPRLAGGDPILVPAILFIGLTIVAWAKVRFADFLPRLFLEEDGLYRIDLILKEFIACFLLYFCARRLTKEPRALRFAMAATAASFSFEMFTGVREFLFTGVWRATGHLANPNRFGVFLAAYMMIPVGFFLSGYKKYRWLAVAAIVGSGLGLLGSVSRGALLGTGVAVTVVALIRRSPWIVVIAVVVATAPFWLPTKVIDRFETAVTSDSSGDVEINAEKEGRIDLWRAGRKMIAANPWGWGLEQFPHHLREFGYTGRKLKSSHNILIQLSAEQGILTALAHLWILGTIGTVGLAMAFRERGSLDSSMGLALCGVTVSFLCTSMFGDGFYETTLSGLFWVLAGISMNVFKGAATSASVPVAASAVSHTGADDAPSGTPRS